MINSETLKLINFLLSHITLEMGKWLQMILFTHWKSGREIFFSSFANTNHKHPPVMEGKTQTQVPSSFYLPVNRYITSQS